MIHQSLARLVTAILTCALLVWTAVAQSGQVGQLTNLPPQHEAIVRPWLGMRPWLRPATERDCTNKEGLDATRQEFGRGYQPYYAAGDFNGDGREDFAVVLVNRRERSMRFAVAVFNGPFDQSRTHAPAFFAEGIDLNDGGLVVLPGDRLIIGVFQSDNCVVLWPRGGEYVMEDCS